MHMADHFLLNYTMSVLYPRARFDDSMWREGSDKSVSRLEEENLAVLHIFIMQPRINAVYVTHRRQAAHDSVYKIKPSCVYSLSSN